MNTKYQICIFVVDAYDFIILYRWEIYHWNRNIQMMTLGWDTPGKITRGAPLEVRYENQQDLDKMVFFGQILEEKDPLHVYSCWKWGVKAMAHTYCLSLKEVVPWPPVGYGWLWRGIW